ncbi:MAG: alpha/beta fold hydrolase [Pseudomonadales bacterium]|nr:alpha/beta fold hydrolase [Pseudomonadales bacterium]
MAVQDKTTSDTHDVIESLYDLPFGGHWSQVQEALCGFWANPASSGDAQEIALLERHFERALALLDRAPEIETRWRSELYRVPLPAAVFTRRGEPIDVNEVGSTLFSRWFDPSPYASQNQRIVRKAILALYGDQISNATLQGGDAETTTLLLRQIQLRSKTESELYMGILVHRSVPTYGLEALAEAYDLTAAETNLCLKLASGMSLDQLADTAEVKKTTLRTQLARCFGKLSVNSQPELVAVVLHNMFAGAQLTGSGQQAPALTRYLDPEIHGSPKFKLITLSDHRKLGFFEYGDADGIPAFYLHGTLDGALIMKNQSLNGTGIRLIAVERGGVGESTPNTDFSPHAYARDIVQLADHLKLDEYIVIGRSMGSWDAVTVTQLDAKRAKLLVLVGGRLPVKQVEDHASHDPFYRTLYNGIWNSDTMGRLMLRVMIVQLMVRGPSQFLVDSGLSKIERDLNENPLYQRHMKALWMRCTTFGVEATHEHLKLYKDAIADPPWEGLTTPTLLIHGANDSNVPLERLLEQTDSFADREVVVLTGLGHRLVAVAFGEVLHTISQHWRQKFSADQRKVG